jgi:transcription elongation GreA/GreB family factor
VKKQEIKSGFIKLCIKNLEENANTAQEAMNDAQQAANDYGLPRDRYDSFRSQLLRKRDMFATQVQNYLDAMASIKSIDLNTVHEKIGFGSMVITEHHKLLIATAIGKLSCQNENYHVISAKTPLYKTIEGLKEGDTFEFNKRKTKILEVF